MSELSENLVKAILQDEAEEIEKFILEFFGTKERLLATYNNYVLEQTPVVFEMPRYSGNDIIYTATTEYRIRRKTQEELEK